MLRIRLSMGGVRKRPIYKIVVADGRYPRDGKFIEKLGSYNPLLPKDKKERVKVEFERVKYWISKGAQPTLRVSRILGEMQLMPMHKPGNNPLKAIPKKDRKKEAKEEQPKAEAKKEEPKKEQPKAEAKKEEPKKEQPKAEAKKGTKKEPKKELKKNLKQRQKRKNLKKNSLKQRQKRKRKRRNQKVIGNVRIKDFYFISRFISWSFGYWNLQKG